MRKSFLLFFSKCINQLKNRTTAKQQLYCQITIIFWEHFLCLKRPSLINYTDGIFLQIHMFRSIDQSLRPMGCMPRILLHLWAFLCVREAGHRGNKITALRFSTKKQKMTSPYITNSLPGSMVNLCKRHPSMMSSVLIYCCISY